MAVLTAKIKASTLVEVLIAMVIVMIAFGIGLMIYINVLQSANTHQKLNARFLLNEVSVQAKIDHAFSDEEIQVGTVNIVKTLEPYDHPMGKLKVLVLKAYNQQGKQLGEQKELIITK